MTKIRKMSKKSKIATKQFIKSLLSKPIKLFPSKNGRKVKCLETGIIYNSSVEAANHLCVSKAAVASACCGTSKTCKNLHFEYVEKNAADFAKELLEKPIEPVKHYMNSKKVKCIETDIIYNSFSEAAKHLETSYQNIKASCENQNCSCKGLHFEYVTETVNNKQYDRYTIEKIPIVKDLVRQLNKTREELDKAKKLSGILVSELKYYKNETKFYENRTEKLLFKYKNFDEQLKALEKDLRKSENANEETMLNFSKYKNEMAKTFNSSVRKQVRKEATAMYKKMESEFEKRLYAYKKENQTLKAQRDFMINRIKFICLNHCGHTVGLTKHHIRCENCDIKGFKEFYDMLLGKPTYTALSMRDLEDLYNINCRLS